MKQHDKAGRAVSRNDFFYVASDNYDEHAELAIPRYVEMHGDIRSFVAGSWDASQRLRVIDLGAGTGKTSEVLLKALPECTVVALDKFPEMLNHARERLSHYANRVSYVEGDFMDLDLGSGFDICVSSLAIHHQDQEGKRLIFSKIYRSLAAGGMFCMIDWTKFADPAMQELAFRVAERHVGRELESVPNVMKDWIHHWRSLNIPDTVEDMCTWLREAGFQYAECISRYYGMALICGKKAVGPYRE